LNIPLRWMAQRTQEDILFCLPRLPRTLLSSDKQLLLSIVDHQWAGHSGAGADFQTWRKARSVGMMPARTVAAVVPALRRIIQVCVAVLLGVSDRACVYFSCVLSICVVRSCCCCCWWWWCRRPCWCCCYSCYHSLSPPPSLLEFVCVSLRVHMQIIVSKVHIGRWLDVGSVSRDHVLRLIFDIAITWTVGEGVRDRQAAVVEDLYHHVHAISQAMFGAPVEFLPGTSAWRGVQSLPKAQVLGAVPCLLASCA
jgi:hypothetical protein